jgi:hypothetical protein
MVTQRIRKTESEREFESVIDDFITQGYKVKSRGQKSAQLMNAKYGSFLSNLLIFIFIGWWTIFIANAIWMYYNYSQKSDKVLVKLVTND